MKKPNIFECYDEAEKKSQLLTRWVDLVLFKGYVYTGLFPIYIHSIWCIFRGNFDTSGWHFPGIFDLVFPNGMVYQFNFSTFQLQWMFPSTLKPFLVGGCVQSFSRLVLTRISQSFSVWCHIWPAVVFISWHAASI